MRDLDFSVEQGSTLFVVPIRESTLIRCIGLETCDAGSIVVNGIELTQRSESVAKIRSLVLSSLFPHLQRSTVLALTEELGLTQSQADERPCNSQQGPDRTTTTSPIVGRTTVSLSPGPLLEPQLMLSTNLPRRRPEMISEVLETMASSAEDGMVHDYKVISLRLLIRLLSWTRGL